METENSEAVRASFQLKPNDKNIVENLLNESDIICPLAVLNGN